MLMLRSYLVAIALAAWVAPSSTSGQTIPAGTHDVPPLVVGDNQSMGSNTTLNIYESGVVGQNFSAGLSGPLNHNLAVNLAGGVIGNGFTARNGAVVNVSSGSIGANATASIGSHLRLTGGTVGSGLNVSGAVEVDGGTLSTVRVSGSGVLSVLAGLGGTVDSLSGTLNVSGGEVRTRNTMFGTVNVSGGKIAGGLVMGQNAELNVSGGEVAGAYIYYYSNVKISGGKIGQGLRVVNASTLQMTGGVIEQNFYVGSSSPVRLAGGVVGDNIQKDAGTHRLVLIGSDFRLDGVPIANLTSDGDTRPFDLPTGGVLTGVYPDGTPFAYSSVEGDKLPAGSLQLEQASLAGAHPAIVSLPASSAPQGVHAGQTLNIQSEAAVDARLMAGWGSTVNVAGGQVGYDFEAAGAFVNVSAGSVGDAFDMFHGSTLNVSGGMLGTNGLLYAASLQMTGGAMGSSLEAKNNSTLHLAGGAIGDGLNLDATSELTIVGGDFRIDGVPIAGLNQPGDAAPFDLPSAMVLSGVLADGTPFAMTTQDFDALPAGALTLQQATLPPVGPANIDAAADNVGQGLRTGQTLAVGAGSQLPAHFNMAPGATLNLSGGAVGQNLEAVGGGVNLNSGVIGPDFDAYQGTILNMTGGQLDQNAWFDNGSQFIQSGGVSSTIAARRASTVQITGGKAGGVTAAQGSLVALLGGELQGLALTDSQSEVSGGLLTGKLSLSGASSLEWNGGRIGAIETVAGGAAATVAIEGAAFYLDGVPVAGLNLPGDQLQLQVPAGAVLSGVLADGTAIAFGNQLRNNDRLPGDQVTLRYSAPPPPAAAIIQVPGDPPPISIRGGQTLRVEQGGAVGNHLTAGTGSRVEVLTGGVIGDDFEAVGANVLVNGGEIGYRLDLFADATLTMLSGRIGVNGHANGVQVLGGTLDLFGGDVVSPITVENGGTLNVFGYDLTLAGVPIAGLLPGEALAITQRDGSVLSGKLADGTPFDFRLQQSTSRSFDIFSLHSTVTVTLAEPSPLPGDFKDDGVVDGGDFLAWQRGETLFPLSEFDLATWRANYGATLGQPAPSTSVPEPATLSSFLLTGLAYIMHRRRPSCSNRF